MVDESEIRIDAIDANATVYKKQAESTEEMLKDVRFTSALFGPFR
jgi:hypothetical protein